MALEIQIKQNLPENLKLLAAQRQLYTEAKRWVFFRLILALFLALYPVWAFLFPEFQVVGSVIIVFSVLFFLYPLIFQTIESKKVETAASIQELFDTTVLGIPWNEYLVKRPRQGDIDLAYERFKGDRESLKDWYAVPTNQMSSEKQALFCQQSNLLWDKDQREVNIKVFWGLMIFIVVAPLLWFCDDDKTSVPTYMTQVFIPLLPLLQLCVENHNAHKSISETQHQFSEAMDEWMWSTDPVSRERLRRVQDAIYGNRKEVALVPNWLYKLLRPAYEKRMQKNSQGKLERIKSISDNSSTT